MARKDISIANFNLLNLNLPGQSIYDEIAAASGSVGPLGQRGVSPP